MSQLEMWLIHGAGTLLVTITAVRFVMQECISLVELYKKLRAAINGKGPDPPQLPSG